MEIRENFPLDKNEHSKKLLRIKGIFMPKKSIISLGILSFISITNLYAMNGEKDDTKNSKTVQRTAPSSAKSKEVEENIEEKYITYVTKNSFVTGSTIALVWWGERWWVDRVTDAIQHSIKSSNPLINLTISSFFRGKTTQDALPVAQEQGKILGIVIAGMAAPIVWDCGSASLRSGHKIVRYVFEDNIPAEQKPTMRDYLKGGLGAAIFGGFCYTAYKAFSH